MSSLVRARPRLSIVGAHAAVVVALGAVVGAGCADQVDYALPTNYELAFPSKDAAVLTESLFVFVVDASRREGQVCNDLFLAKQSGAKLEGVLSIAKVPLCDAASGAAPIDVSFGARAFFVVGARRNEGILEDYLYGCTVSLVGQQAPRPHVTLGFALANEAAAPVSACPSVSELCAGNCQQ